jgi:hypothetical protein
MDDEDSQGDLARKRTARVLLANGALEARAYVGPTALPADSDHKTIEMRTVAVDEALDPRRKATVARGMGEALAVLEGEIVDPTTGQVIPAVDPRAVPNTPWAHGKRPTHLKGMAPPKIGATGAGIAAAAPGYGAYIAAGAIVVAAIACAGLIIATRGNSTTAPTSSAPSASPPAAPTTARVLEPAPAPSAEPAPVPATSAAPDPGPAVAPPTGKPTGPLPGKGASSPPGTPAPPSTPTPAKSSGRIF